MSTHLDQPRRASLNGRHPDPAFLLSADLIEPADWPREVRDAAAHAAHCGACQRVRASGRQALESWGQAVESTADAHFPADRLARQRASILRRLQIERPAARILRFPQRTASPTLRPGSARRWIASAAAAGLIVGMAAGHVLHLGGGLFDGPVRALRQAPRLQPASATLSSHSQDEAFLTELEAALTDYRIDELRALDELTPRTADVVVRR